MVVDIGAEISEVGEIVIHVVLVALILDMPTPGTTVADSTAPSGVGDDHARQLRTTANKAQSRRCMLLLLTPPLKM